MRGAIQGVKHAQNLAKCTAKLVQKTFFIIKGTEAVAHFVHQGSFQYKGSVAVVMQPAERAMVQVVLTVWTALMVSCCKILLVSTAVRMAHMSLKRMESINACSVIQSVTFAKDQQ